VTAMKQFAILRQLPLELGWEDIDASAIQNMVYMGLGEADMDVVWEPRILGVQWVRTYWQPGSDWGLCLYTAPDERAVRDWHDLCHVPYAGIEEIEVEEGPTAAADYPRGFHAPASAAPLVAVQATAPGALEVPLTHIRTYRYQSGEQLALYLPAPDVAPPASAPRIRRVVEIRPGDYL